MEFIFSLLNISRDKNSSSQEEFEKQLVGMQEVKEQVNTIIDGLQFLKERQKMGFTNSKYHNVHMMIGAPGTAKTTVARYMGKIMAEKQLLPASRFISLNAAELKAEYLGQSAHNTKRIVENHDVIFIDEAYSLVSETGEKDLYSQDVISQLLVEIENHSTNKLFIFAGYGGKDVSAKNDRMRQFIDANPGIKSRINSTIYFKPYDTQQMIDIIKSVAENQDYIIEEDAIPIISNYFSVRIAQDNFGNGREARSLLENAVINMGRRVMQKKRMTKKDAETIKREDFELAIEKATFANTCQQIHSEKSVQIQL